MSINIDQWHARIGSFIQKIESVRTGSTRYYRYLNIINYTSFDSWWYWSQPWAYKKTSDYFSCCQWSINSILANKISLVTVYNILQKFDIICISETYLDSTVDDKTIEIKGYNLIRADYPNNQRRGGVCLYFRGNLCLRLKFHFFLNVIFVRLILTIKRAVYIII